MSGFCCDDLERTLAGGSVDAEQAAGRREHLRTCLRCREQAVADAVLRGGFPAPPPELSAGFEARLRRRLNARRDPERRRAVWGFTLAAYVTAATFASIAILSELPWHDLAAPRAVSATVAGLVLAGPLLLLDRIGVLRPPG